MFCYPRWNPSASNAYCATDHGWQESVCHYYFLRRGERLVRQSEILEKGIIFKKNQKLYSSMKILEEVPFLGRIADLAYTMLLVILISAIIGLILAFPVQWLWNFVFGKIHTITVFQAWALNVLTGILIGRGPSGKK